VEGFDTYSLENKRNSTSSWRGGCGNRSSQQADGYSVLLNGNHNSNCSSFVDGETTWMYAPGCSNLGVTGNRRSSGHCSEDDKLVTNLGNPVMGSSNQVLGRVDVPSQIAGSENPLSSVVSVDQQETKGLNLLSSPIQISQAGLGDAFRPEQFGEDSFNTDEANLSLDFDHQLVMSGKFAHLVRKSGKGPRSLELGDLVFLLLFAILPEKKQIKHLFHGLRQFKIF
jgi:hypothetical protein